MNRTPEATKAKEAPYASQRLRYVAENLYRNENDVYYVKMKKHGKQYKQSLDTHDRKTADRKLTEFEKKVEREADEMPDVLFEDHAETWLASIKAGLKEMSYRRRETCVNQLKPFFAGKMMREIKNDHFERWQAKRATVAAQTFNLDRDTLSLIFEYAKKLNIVRDNPVKEIKKRKRTKKVVVPPTRDQFKKLVETIRANVWAKEAGPLVEFLAYTGQRLNEALQVRWKDIDFKKDNILITGGERGTKNLKQRVIPLFPPVKALLLRISEGKEMPANDCIFTHKSSKTALKRACRVMGLAKDEYFNHHSMRHFFCSNAIEEGIDFARIAQWLGHSDGGKLAASTYGHLRKSHGDEQAKKMTFTA